MKIHDILANKMMNLNRIIFPKFMAGFAIQLSLDKAKHQLLKSGFTKIDYLDLRDATTLAPSLSAKGDNRLFVAAWLGETRLIDNCAIGSHADIT